MLIGFNSLLASSTFYIQTMKTILNHLKTISPPRMIREGLALYGIKETPGSKSNPVIVNWAKETQNKLDNWYNNDATPWCSLFMLVVAHRAIKDTTGIDLTALSWTKFGKKINSNEASLGDVLVFKRTGGGHVGLYVGEDKTHYYVLGGNQSNMVNIAKLAKNRLFSVQRPIYNIQPESVKKIIITDGHLLKESTNEQ
jgi:uncharacterized protein (TIGR02594 family)